MEIRKRTFAHGRHRTPTPCREKGVSRSSPNPARQIPSWRAPKVPRSFISRSEAEGFGTYIVRLKLCFVVRGESICERLTSRPSTAAHRPRPHDFPLHLTPDTAPAAGLHNHLPSERRWQKSLDNRKHIGFYAFRIVCHPHGSNGSQWGLLRSHLKVSAQAASGIFILVPVPKNPVQAPRICGSTRLPPANNTPHFSPNTTIHH